MLQVEYSKRWEKKAHKRRSWGNRKEAVFDQSNHERTRMVGGYNTLTLEKGERSIREQKLRFAGSIEHRNSRSAGPGQSMGSRYRGTEDKKTDCSGYRGGGSLMF